MSWMRGAAGLVFFFLATILIGGVRIYLGLPDMPLWYDVSQNASGVLLWLIVNGRAI